MRSFLGNVNVSKNFCYLVNFQDNVPVRLSFTPAVFPLRTFTFLKQAAPGIYNMFRFLSFTAQKFLCTVYIQQHFGSKSKSTDCIFAPSHLRSPKAIQSTIPTSESGVLFQSTGTKPRTTPEQQWAATIPRSRSSRIHAYSIYRARKRTASTS